MWLWITQLILSLCRYHVHGTHDEAMNSTSMLFKLRTIAAHALFVHMQVWLISFCGDTVTATATPAAKPAAYCSG